MTACPIKGRVARPVPIAIVTVSAGALDPAGNLIVAGSSNGWYTAKFAAGNGALLWEQRGGFAMAYEIQGAGAVAVEKVAA